MNAVEDALAASAYLETRIEEFIDDLVELVEIDSGTYDKDGVDRVGAWLRGRYEALGGYIRTYPHPDFGNTFTSTWKGDGSGSVLLIGHTDTVYSRGTVSARPVNREGNKLSGPGTADMKGGDLSIVFALEALFAAGVRNFGTVTVLHNSDEEIGSPTSRDLIRSESRTADAVLVLEAGRENGDVVSARKGIAGFTLTIQGQSAHAGVNHSRGRSAALELAHLVVALEGINGTIDGVTLNVGKVSAGERTNVVPFHAEAEFEIRAFEPSDLERAMERAAEIVEHRTIDGTEATLVYRGGHTPMPRSPGNARLVTLAQQISNQLGFNLHDTATGGASDGNTAAAEGRPVLDGLGPQGGAAHSPDEYILIDSIVPRTSLLAGLISSSADVK